MKHCLVVEDSRVVRTVACNILEELDFETDEAEDGAAALTSCRERMPELVLLDWNMPNSSAMEFLQGLRHADNGEQPVVVFTITENDYEQIKEAMLAGANEYVLKPFDRTIIAEKLREIGLA